MLYSLEELKKINIPSSLLRLGCSAAAHPMEYAKVLIQIGYEPIAPQQTISFWTRKPVLKYPSLLRYIQFIYQRDGPLGLYRGIRHRILELSLSLLLTEKLESLWKKTEIETKEDEDLSEEDKKLKLLYSTTRDSSLRILVLFLTQPFHVLSVRAMAAFIGGEESYNGLLSGLLAIGRENGLFGYWSGLIPRILGELLFISLTTSLSYLINNYVLDEKEYKQYSSLIVNFFTSSFCYPFTVVTNVMVVSRCGLIAGYPPNMPLYTSWLHAWEHLSKNGQLKRGSSVFLRYYNGPHIIVGNRVMPLNPSVLSSSFN